MLQIGDYGDPGVPFFLYQDLSFGTLERRYDEISRYVWIPPETVARRRAHQDDLYKRAAGVFTMSEWLARDLVQHGQLPAEKTYAVGGGINVSASQPVRPPQKQSGRLLFVGRDFHRKGGDLVVEAFQRLRGSTHPTMTLTVAGPKSWSLPGTPPQGVQFLGDVALETVATLYRSHDLFVMPSRFEPFGLVFLEALAYGLPCIGRRAFAMAEIIEPGMNGALVASDDPDELARAITSVLDDENIYEACAANAQRIRTEHSWDAVVDRMLPTIARAVR